MIWVWASSGRVCVLRDGHAYAERVRVEQLARTLDVMGVRGGCVGEGRHEAVAHGARGGAAARRVPVSAPQSGVHPRCA